MRSFINQNDMQGPIFVTPPERLYLPNIPGHLQLNLTHGFYQIEFDPTRQKQSIFDMNKIFAHPSPDLQERLDAARQN